MRYTRPIIHFVAYYMTWIACIVNAASGDAWMGPIIAILLIVMQICLQVFFNAPWRTEILFALTLMVAGIIVDTLFMQTGWIIFKANPFAGYLSPPWMACLWLSYGFTITVTSRAWLHRYIILGGLTFISLPFAYWIGVLMGAADIRSVWFYLLLGGVWMLLLPVLLQLYLLYVSKKACMGK